MRKINKRIISLFLIISLLTCMTGCSGGAPKGVSDEMYGYTKEISDMTHDYLDGKIVLSDTKEPASALIDDITLLLENENSEGLLDEKYYNDKEISQKALTVLLFLYSKDSIHELEAALSDLDELLNNK